MHAATVGRERADCDCEEAYEAEEVVIDAAYNSPLSGFLASTI